MDRLAPASPPVRSIVRDESRASPGVDSGSDLGGGTDTVNWEIFMYLIHNVFR